MKNNSILPWLFGSKSKTGSLWDFEECQSKNSNKRLPPTPIIYDSTLIQKLKADHVELFRQFNEINAIFERGDYTALPEFLVSFRLALQTHLAIENVKFYAYVQQHLTKTPKMMYFVDNIKKEMDDIAHAIMRFINNYKTHKMIEEEIIEFKEELKEITDILVKRIRVEEKQLYTLYMASY